MNEYRTKIGEGGRIVIPASCRRHLQLKLGEELIIRIDNGELHLFSVKQSLKKAQALVQKHAKNQNLVAKLKSMRQQDEVDE